MSEVKSLIVSGGTNLVAVAKQYDKEATKEVRNGWKLFGDRQILKDEKGYITMVQTLIRGENVTPVISLTPTPR